MVANFATLMVEMVVLNILLLTLHRFSPRYGIMPMVAVAAALVGIMRFASAVSVYIQLMPDLRFTVAGNVFVPTILLVVLVVYVVEGTVPARLTIGVVIGIEILSLLLYASLAWHLHQPGGGSLASIPLDEVLVSPTPRLAFASALSFLIDLYTIAMLYQAFVNFVPKLPLWLKAALSLSGAMILNSVIFWLLVADSFEEFIAYFPGSMIGGVIAALLLTPVLAIYLGLLAPRMPHYRGADKRRTLELLFGSFGQIERRLERIESTLENVEAHYRSEVDQQRIRVERLRDFVNEVVHDMRSPLSGINLRINLLHRASDPFQRERHLTSIESQIARLSALVDVVVEIARLEREPTLERQVSDLGEFVADLFEACRMSGEAKSLVMRCDIAATPPLRVRLDKLTFGRALTNLIENAVRYTESGAVTLRVKSDASGKRAVIEVEDTGIGITPEELPSIFERYFRSRSEKVANLDSGLGLGLAVVKRVIEQHGGTISVESQPKTGSLFRVTLPLAEDTVA